MSGVSLEEALRGRYRVGFEHTELENGETVVEAYYEKIPACMAEGETEQEARENLRKLKEPYLRKLEEIGTRIPVPDFQDTSETQTEGTGKEFASGEESPSSSTTVAGMGTSRRKSVTA